MMTGSDGVSFLLPQLFLSQHRLQRGEREKRRLVVVVSVMEREGLKRQRGVSQTCEQQRKQDKAQRREGEEVR